MFSLKPGQELWGIYGGVLVLLFFWFSKLGSWVGMGGIWISYHGGLFGLAGHARVMGA